LISGAEDGNKDLLQRKEWEDKDRIHASLTLNTHEKSIENISNICQTRQLSM
jgi:hypothetical protein